MSLNVNKPRFMIFYKTARNINNIPEINLDNVPLEFNLLGLTIQNSLQWDAHINNIQGNICKKLRVKNKVKHYVPNKILLAIY